MPDLFTPEWVTALNLVQSATTDDAAAAAPSADPLREDPATSLEEVAHYYTDVHRVTLPFDCSGPRPWNEGIGSVPSHRVHASADAPVRAQLAAMDVVRHHAERGPQRVTVCRLVCKACADRLLEELEEEERAAEDRADFDSVLYDQLDPEDVAEFHRRHAAAVAEGTAAPAAAPATKRSHSFAFEEDITPEVAAMCGRALEDELTSQVTVI
mmetsp:Transcript_5737/g.17079  ORF Transcript_5737/g.17079 Transcript_5737/m.17079 type:complete len:212 (+) Transcript_5737:87-722(+)